MKWKARTICIPRSHEQDPHLLRSVCECQDATGTVGPEGEGTRLSRSLGHQWTACATVRWGMACCIFSGSIDLWCKVWPLGLHGFRDCFPGFIIICDFMHVYKVRFMLTSLWSSLSCDSLS